MRIIEIISQLSSGGAERFTVDLCNELSKEHEVTLIVLYPLETHGFYAHEVSSDVNLISMNARSKSELGLYFGLRVIIKEIDPDVVHSHLGGLMASLLSVLTLKKVRFYHTIHSDAKKDAKTFVRGMVNRFCFKTGLVKAVTISAESQRSFDDFYGMNTPMILNGRGVPEVVSVSNSVIEEITSFRKNINTKVLVCLARIDEVKRQTMLARIAKRLESEGENFALLMIGSMVKQDLVREIEEIQCKSVHILGERQNPLEYLKFSDAFCLCSSHEGMPISLIEAMAMGAVPICTPVGGIVNVINSGVNGFLSEDLKEESYYKALKSFLKMSVTDVNDMKQKVIDSHAPFTMRECASKYVDLFDRK